MGPRVSVVMPVYNARRFVDRTIASVLGQTFSDFEFVIVDDGSTDGSLDVLRERARQDDRIALISRPNTGIVGALNDGLARATGEFIARIDADDLCAPQRFAKQVTRLDAEPELVALGCQATVTDAAGRRLGEYRVPLTHEEIEAQHLAGYSSIHHPAVMMRADAVRRAGAYREGFCPAEDYDLWMRLGEIGRLANLPEVLITKRLTEDGIVGSMLEKNRPIVTRILGDAWQRRGLPGAPVAPTPDTLTRSGLYRKWAWMALGSGEVGTARRYACKAAFCAPHDKESWRAVYCALRGR